MRGTAAAVIATLVAATGHTLSGGGAPDPLLVAAVACLAAPFAVLLAGRRSTLVGTALVVSGAQALFHGAFALVDDARPLPGTGHAHVPIPAADLAAAAAAAPAEPSAMPLGHLLAAVVTIAAVRHGEQLLRRLSRGILRRTSRHLPVLRQTAAPTLAPTARDRVLRPRHIAQSSLSRRGPPAFAR